MLPGHADYESDDAGQSDDDDWSGSKPGSFYFIHVPPKPIGFFEIVSVRQVMSGISYPPGLVFHPHFVKFQEHRLGSPFQVIGLRLSPRACFLNHIEKTSHGASFLALGVWF